MRIAICGSMLFLDKMNEVKTKLEKFRHEVIVPADFNLDYVELGKNPEKFGEIKIKFDAINDHVWQIERSEGILVVNIEKNGIANYIGGNTLIEIGYAFTSKKDIFFLNAIPDVNYKSELIGVSPIILNGDLSKIDEYYKNLDSALLASDSEIKFRAAILGLRDAGKKVNLEMQKTESKIAEQPIGFEQILEGAQNRLDQVLDKNHQLYISIESGLVEVSGQYFDIAICLIQDKTGKKGMSISPGMPIPKEAVDFALENNSDVGVYVQEKFKTESKDPEVVFTNGQTSREKILRELVKNTFFSITHTLI